jgi:putative flippase GtrA
MKPEDAPQVLRFAGIGLAATIAHVSVAAATINLLSVPVASANALAVLSASLLSYFGHALWTFKAPPTADSFLRFAAVTAAAAALAALLAALVAEIGGRWWSGIVVTAVVVPVFSYWVHRSWTFRRSGH